MKKPLGSFLLFLMGMVTTVLYYLVWVDPKLVEELELYCPATSRAYPGAWALDLLYPLVPATLILGLIYFVLFLNSKRK